MSLRSKAHTLSHYIVFSTFFNCVHIVTPHLCHRKARCSSAEFLGESEQDAETEGLGWRCLAQQAGPSLKFPPAPLSTASAGWAHPKGQRSLAMTSFDAERGTTQVGGSQKRSQFLVFGHRLLSECHPIQWMERQSLRLLCAPGQKPS